MERAVLDPGDLKTAFITADSFAERLLAAWTQGDFELVVCPRLLEELDQDLTKPQMRRFFPASRARAFIEQIRSNAILLEDPETDRGRASNVEKEYLVALAKVSDSTYLVSSDPSLTGLNDVSPPVITPGEFLQKLTAGG